MKGVSSKKYINKFLTKNLLFFVRKRYELPIKVQIDFSLINEKQMLYKIVFLYHIDIKKFFRKVFIWLVQLLNY